MTHERRRFARFSAGIRYEYLSEAIDFIPPPTIHATARFMESLRTTGSLPKMHERTRTLTDEECAQFRLLPLDEQYATFCGIGERDFFSDRYTRGLSDFRKLVHVRGVECIGINWEREELLIGSEHISIEDETKTVRDIGAFVISYSNTTYEVANATRAIGDYGHPHAMQHSRMCMNAGNNTVHMSIVDGQYSRATDIILTALRMEHGTVTVTVPYAAAALAHWPVKKEENE